MGGGLAGDAAALAQKSASLPRGGGGGFAGGCLLGGAGASADGQEVACSSQYASEAAVPIDGGGSFTGGGLPCGAAADCQANAGRITKAKCFMARVCLLKG